MNVLYISHENNLGGATKSMLALIDHMIELDNNVIVFVPKFNEDTKAGDLVSELKKRKIRYMYYRAYWWMYPKENKNNFLKHLKDIIKIIITYFTCLKVVKLLKNEKIDIIHSNSSVTFVGAVLSQKLKTKHVWHIREFGNEDHGLDFVLSRKKCVDFMKTTTDKFICISKSIREKYLKDFSVEKCILIYNGVKSDNEYKEIKKRPDGNYNLLISGRIKKSKGQLEAVKAIDLLVKKGYKNILLNIAGNSDEEYLLEIKKYIYEKKLENNVIIHDYISNLSAFRNGMDIELVCSKMEAFGRVTVEAMLASNVVIGANTGGTAEIIKNNSTGLLYEYGNEVDLANKIEQCIISEDLRRNLSKNAYEYASKNFTSIINANRIYKLYESILWENIYETKD